MVRAIRSSEYPSGLVRTRSANWREAIRRFFSSGLRRSTASARCAYLGARIVDFATAQKTSPRATQAKADTIPTRTATDGTTKASVSDRMTKAIPIAAISRLNWDAHSSVIQRRRISLRRSISWLYPGIGDMDLYSSFVSFECSVRLHQRQLGPRS